MEAQVTQTLVVVYGDVSRFCVNILESCSIREIKKGLYIYKDLATSI